MSSYGLHLANLAENQGVDLSAGPVKTVVCSAEPLSDAKRQKLERSWGARVRDTFGMTEAGMMGAEDATLGGFRVWTDLYYIEVVDPQTHHAGSRGRSRRARRDPAVDESVHALSSDGCRATWSPCGQPTTTAAPMPYSRCSGTRIARPASSRCKGMNINHPEFEDFMFSEALINDFKCELLAPGGNDVLRVSIEVKRDADRAAAAAALVKRVKQTFEVTPEVVLLESGTLAREFESSVKAPRFADRR